MHVLQFRFLAFISIKTKLALFFMCPTKPSIRLNMCSKVTE